jgi:tripartite-type tricarboxylate transporter receptor subunit TctC
MTYPHRVFTTLIALPLLALASVFSINASAQNWPVRSARIVVPFHGGADIQGRILARKFYEAFGQTFVVDNRSGAGGTIGAEIVAKAPPDGYTLLFSTSRTCRTKAEVQRQAIMVGEVDLRFTGQLAALPHIKAGRVRPLAVASMRKSAIMPDLPTLDSMYRGFDADNWYAMFIPAGTPKDIIAKLSAEIVKVLQAPDMRDAITKDGAEPVGSTPEELGAYFRREIEKYAKVIKAANVQVE